MLFGLANRTIPTALCIADAQEGRGDLPYPLPEWGGVGRWRGLSLR